MNQGNKIREFTDLKVWQEAHKLTLMVYSLSRSFPKDELFALTSQMRRASVSIASNIAEGFGRQTYREKYQFYYQSHGSLTEIKSQLLLARDLKYISIEQFESVDFQLKCTHSLLRGILAATKKKFSGS